MDRDGHRERGRERERETVTDGDTALEADVHRDAFQKELEGANDDRPQRPPAERGVVCPISAQMISI